MSAGSGVEGVVNAQLGAFREMIDAGTHTADERGGARIRKEGVVAMLRLCGGDW